MNEFKITLSEEQAQELSTTIYTIFSKQIEQVRKDASLNKRYFTKKETCQYLHISNNTLDKWVNQGLPKIVIEGVVRFDKEAVNQWLHCFSQ
ncbi:helix-turn-helix domain-containing protein [Enterococcus sp. AZ196]|uniref:helix-turn-helix domain-containing protein n=1 Tax=Enterococcus sp. AZ196 TaxID=2774659 RepID=UPI003D281FF0